MSRTGDDGVSPALRTFAAAVCERFAIGDLDEVSIVELAGGANRLWRLDSGNGRYVVKEFRYTMTDTRWIAAVRRAAEFEHQVWTSGVVPMAQPIPTTDGDLVPQVASSRGGITLARIHRWVDGAAVQTPTDPATAVRAGGQLAMIQRRGARFQAPQQGILRWWRWRPSEVLERLRRAGLVADDRSRHAATLLNRTERLVAAGERANGPWTFGHFDHKPTNVLHVGGELCVLDWDEAAPCLARHEAVEAALRWAGIEDGRVSDDLFIAFVSGYHAGGGDLSRLRPPDFAKCVAGLLGGFDYQGRRALREFDDTDTEAAEAATTALATLDSLDYVFDRLGAWSALTGP